MNKNRVKWLAFACYVVVLLVMAYGSTVLYRGRHMYKYIKSHGIIMDGVIETHSTLGYAPRPNSSGSMLMQAPPDIRFSYDGERCRIAEDQREDLQTPKHLFLGCSFTHGDVCRFVETYPSRVAKHFGANPRNRGFCAYGLSQMVLIARSAVPEMKPKYVFAQYSPWIVTRSLSHFAPTFFARRPQPYIFLTPDGEPDIHPPTHNAYQIQTPLAQFRDTENGFMDKVSFLQKAALPLYFNEDVRYAGYLARCALGDIPAAMEDRRAALEYGYGEIKRICEQNGAKLLVPVIGSFDQEPMKGDLQVLRSLDGIEVVDCWAPLLERLPDVERSTFMAEYAHFRGSPPQMVDAHPNGTAHAVIADAIIAAIDAQASATDGMKSRTSKTVLK